MSWIPNKPQVIVTLSKSEFEEAKRKEANTRLIIFIIVVIFSIIFVFFANIYNNSQNNTFVPSNNEKGMTEGNILYCRLGLFTPQEGSSIYQDYKAFSSGSEYITKGEVIEHKVSYCKVRYHDVNASNLSVNEQHISLLDCEYSLGNTNARKCEAK